MRGSLLIITTIGAVICSFSLALAQTAQEDCKPKIGWIPLPSHMREVKSLEAKVVELETVLATRIEDLETAIAALDALVAGNAQDILANENATIVNGANISNNVGNIASNNAALATNATAIAGNATGIANNVSQISTIGTTLTNQGVAISTLENSNVMDLEPYISVGTDISNFSAVFISGVNLYIRNGTGRTTDGAVNGLGNLIVGYNELRGSGDVRSGSHNIVIGRENNYSSYGGLVAGYNNTTSNNYASVLGGRYNRATGAYASVSGGRSNIAEGDYSSVSGGGYNMAVGAYSSVNGGSRNGAFADDSSILGGRFNYTGDVSWDPNNGNAVFDGDHGVGAYSTVSAGLRNRAKALYSSITGGSSLTVTANYDLANPYHP